MPSFKWILLFAIRALLWKILLEECQVVEDTTDLILILIFYEWIPVVLVGAYFLFFFDCSYSFHFYYRVSWTVHTPSMEEEGDAARLATAYKQP